MVSQPIEGLASDETPWGLARTSDGFLTLVGPATVARVDLKGHVTERVALQRPQLNLFGLGETLLLQPATPTADEAVLRRVRLSGGPPLFSFCAKRRQAPLFPQLADGFVGLSAFGGWPDKAGALFRETTLLGDGLDGCSHLGVFAQCPRFLLGHK